MFEQKRTCREYQYCDYQKDDCQNTRIFIDAANLHFAPRQKRVRSCGLHVDAGVTDVAEGIVLVEGLFAQRDFVDQL